MKTFAIVAVAFVLAACAKGGNTSAAASASASAEANNPASASDGAVVYRNNCSSCHQLDGKGLRGAFPPLAGNPTVTGNPTAVIVVVKNGLEGRVVVNGVTYSGIMPHWGGVLSDEQIASVITYIRSSWHNGAQGVSLAQVRAVK
ncbi:MAG: cytochrome c [Candidatus Eremiobacteraeota bacterium]|nr:cytochrome c [Candidatus Eremiobacteraeota bacterium]MBV9056415.1 cytochrome c [Candidatus Eremiobacteraeota bacterium]MBV9700802.1 cytochrome c [Candidatus Eremiobacteraeota bacterium]